MIKVPLTGPQTRWASLILDRIRDGIVAECDDAEEQGRRLEWLPVVDGQTLVVYDGLDFVGDMLARLDREGPKSAAASLARAVRAKLARQKLHPSVRRSLGLEAVDA